MVAVVVSDAAMDAAHQGRRMTSTTANTRRSPKVAPIDSRPLPVALAGNVVAGDLPALTHREVAASFVVASVEPRYGAFHDAAADSLTYTVPGKPVTWQRDNVYKGRFITDKGNRTAKRAHAWAFTAARKHKAWTLDGAFAIEVVGFYANARVGDVDRLATLAMDALEGVAYEADRQVRSLSASIATGSPERVEVRVVRLAVDPVQKKRKAGQ